MIVKIAAYNLEDDASLSSGVEVLFEKDSELVSWFIDPDYNDGEGRFTFDVRPEELLAVADAIKAYFAPLETDTPPVVP